MKYVNNTVGILFVLKLCLKNMSKKLFPGRRFRRKLVSYFLVAD